MNHDATTSHLPLTIEITDPMLHDHLSRVLTERQVVRAGQYGPAHDLEHVEKPSNPTEHLAREVRKRLMRLPGSIDTVGYQTKVWVQVGQLALAALEVLHHTREQAADTEPLVEPVSTEQSDPTTWTVQANSVTDSTVVVAEGFGLGEDGSLEFRTGDGVVALFARGAWTNVRRNTSQAATQGAR